MDGQSSTFAQPAEGFRGVRWCTRRSEIPWQWSDSGFAAPCAQRADEDFDVFGVRAAELTYTFRNSLLYGVRIEIAGKEYCRLLIETLKKAYAPTDRVERRGQRVWRWQTQETSIWVEWGGARDGILTACL